MTEVTTMKLEGVSVKSILESEEIDEFVEKYKKKFSEGMSKEVRKQIKESLISHFYDCLAAVDDMTDDDFDENALIINNEKLGGRYLYVPILNVDAFIKILDKAFEEV